MKDYKKILEGVVDIINATEKSDIGFANICTYIGENCPELKESEDERIRKEIIEAIKGQMVVLHPKECIAWLEKQDEQKQELLTKEKALKNSPFVEQKSAEWSEDDQSNFCELRSFIVETYRAEDASKLITWLESLKERVQPQDKQEWSEEDKNMLQSILDEYKSMPIEKRNWLKSLKDRVQLQNIAYYNPYKEVVESIAKMCKHYDNMDVGSLQDFYDNVKVKCKDAKEYDSLFPQSRWKPSDEQMKILNEVLNFAANHESPYWNDYIFGTLNNLIRQLKKL